MTLKNGFSKCSLFVLTASEWEGEIIPSSFSHQRKPNMEKALFDWPIMLQYHVKAKCWLISSEFPGMKFFQPSVPLTNKKPPAFVSVR